MLYELTRQEVEQLADEPEHLRDTSSAVEQRAMLARLRDDERYGVIFIECY